MKAEEVLQTEVMQMKSETKNVVPLPLNYFLYYFPSSSSFSHEAPIIGS